VRISKATEKDHYDGGRSYINVRTLFYVLDEIKSAKAQNEPIAENEQVGQ
jgi:hypothetical protein